MSIVGYGGIRRPAARRELRAGSRVAPSERPCTERTHRRWPVRVAIDAPPSLLRLGAEFEDHRDGALPVHSFAGELGAIADGRERRLDGVGRADRHLVRRRVVEEGEQLGQVIGQALGRFGVAVAEDLDEFLDPGHGAVGAWGVQKSRRALLTAFSVFGLM